jgi:hypothetical protein
MKSLPALSLLSAVNAMGSAHVRLALEGTTVPNHCADPWPMEQTDLLDRTNTVTVRRAGRASTAMFAPQARHVML